MTYKKIWNNEPVEVFLLDYQDGWFIELQQFVGEENVRWADFDSGILIKINGEWKLITTEVHLIKTPSGIRIVPDFNLLG